MDDRKAPKSSAGQALTGILFVLKSGIAWEMLPQEMGYGSGMTPYQVLVGGGVPAVQRRGGKIANC